MMNRLIKFLKTRFLNRQIIALVIFAILFIILILRLFVLQVVLGHQYKDDFNLKIQKKININSTRGNIYDCNGNLLAYDKLSYDIKIEDDGTFDYLTNNEKNNKLNKIIVDTIDIIIKNKDEIIDDFGIILNSNNEFVFDNMSTIQRRRFIADVYGLANITDLSHKQMEQSANDIIKYLCSEERYNINREDYSNDMLLKLINVRYAMTLNSYTKYIDTIIAKNVNTTTVASISERLNELRGVSVIDSSLRCYNESKYVSSIIGYVGQISTDEYKHLSKQDKDKYSINDTIGKAGLEKELNSTLSGKKGSKTIYIDSLGNIIKTTNQKDPSSGNDLYLSIDLELQQTAYDMIERELTGILLPRIINVIEYDPSNEKETSDIKVPISDIYAAFFTNSLLNIDQIPLATEETTSS